VVITRKPQNIGGGRMCNCEDYPCCGCGLDDSPVDCDSDTWSEIYGAMDNFEEFLDHDHSMDY
jgi:hypothetical protein